MTHRAFKFAAEVGAGGKLEVTLPLPPGSRVEVVVLAAEGDEFQGLRDAAARTMGFWDNPADEEAWSDA